MEPKAPESGKGDGTSKWEELGFGSEAAMVEAASNANDLRGKIEVMEADLAKERAAKSKTDSEFMRQSNEIGELRKKLAGSTGELQETKPEEKDDKKAFKPEELLDSVSEEEAAMLDGVLNDPKNAELKKRVAIGGPAAMAEFVQAYRSEAPVDVSASLFAGLKKKKTDTVQKASIAKAVKDLFSQHNQNERNSLAAATSTGAPPDRAKATERQMAVGGVSADFFRKKE